MRHFLETDDLTVSELARVLDLSDNGTAPQMLANLGYALIFEKPSLRTRNSMEMAVSQLGGHPVYISGEEVGLGARESISDITKSLATFHAGIGARVFQHSSVEEMAAANAVPIVNLLSNQGHPMQALADLLTIRQEFGTLQGRSIAFIGDANNVAFSLGLAALRLGMEFRIACPDDYFFTQEELARIAAVGEVSRFVAPAEAVEGVDVVYSDVWTSMGQEAQSARRKQDFEGYQVNSALISQAATDAIFLHCLPAHRGQEVTDEVIDGEQSRVWQQAENRMHASRGLLAWLFGEANQ